MQVFDSSFGSLYCSILYLALVAASAPLALAQAGQVTLQQIVERVEQSQLDSRKQAVPYTVTRQYVLSSAAGHPSSEVLAHISFVPPSEKDYTISSVEGSDRGESIVRKVLDHESQMAGHSEDYAISRRNYDFALLGRESLDGHDCYVLQLTPKRKVTELLRGKAWVDADGFWVRRMAGEPAKNPSWWLKNLQLQVDYSQVDQMWLAHSTRAVAEVRLLGTHVLTARDLSVIAGTATAANVPARHPVRRSKASQQPAAAAVWVPR